MVSSPSSSSYLEWPVGYIWLCPPAFQDITLSGFSSFSLSLENSSSSWTLNIGVTMAWSLVFFSIYPHFLGDLTLSWTLYQTTYLTYLHLINISNSCPSNQTYSTVSLPHLNWSQLYLSVESSPHFPLCPVLQQILFVSPLKYVWNLTTSHHSTAITFIISCLDYCNSFLTGLSSTLALYSLLYHMVAK